MATYDLQPINKNTSWGGDVSTMGLPVSGNRVEEFIKNSLLKRLGYIFNYGKANKYIIFADEEDFNTWAEGKDFESSDSEVINSNLLDNNLIVLVLINSNKIHLDNFIQSVEDDLGTLNLSVDEIFRILGENAEDEGLLKDVKDLKTSLKSYEIILGGKPYVQTHNVFRITNTNKENENTEWILEYPIEREVDKYNVINYIKGKLELRLGPFDELVNIEEDLTQDDITIDLPNNTVKIDLHTLVDPGEEIIIKIIN